MLSVSAHLKFIQWPTVKKGNLYQPVAEIVSILINSHEWLYLQARFKWQMYIYANPMSLI